METLIGLIVPAVEAVDRRREQRKRLMELCGD
jgi:hypothetical protein